MLGLLLSKARDAAAWDRALLQTSNLSWPSRLGLLARRYAAVALNRRSLSFLGRELRFDNRFTPLIMGSYVHDVASLGDLIDLSRVRTVLDVGANVGQFAVSLARLYPHVQGWSFEPNRDILPLLEANLSQTGWTVVPYGLGDDGAAERLWYVPGKSGQGSFIRANSENGLSGTSVAVDVQTVALTPETRERFAIPACIDLVKVDVEGAERAALQGLAEVSWRYMSLEISTAHRDGLTLDGALELLTEQHGVTPDVIWEGPVADGAAARDVVLAWPEPAAT